MDKDCYLLTIKNLTKKRKNPSIGQFQRAFGTEHIHDEAVAIYFDKEGRGIEHIGFNGGTLSAQRIFQMGPGR